MLLILIKNNAKLLIRNKISFMFMCLLPIVLILILSSALANDFGKKVEMQPFTVGYKIESGSNIASYFPVFKEQYEANGMILKPMNQKEGMQALSNSEIVSYLTLNDERYTIYNQEDININAMIFESSFKGSMHFYDGLKTMIAYSVQNRVIAASEGMIQMQPFSNREGQEDWVKKEHLEVDPIPRSQDYYGIVQIVFIIWMGISCVVALTEAERKNNVSNRIKLANVKPAILFMGRFIPNVVALCVQVGIAIVVSTLLLNVNWGDKLFLSGMVLLFEVIAVSAFGTMLTLLIKSSTIINMFMYIGAFVFGFTGGSFQTYMYNFISEDIVHLSPLYYLNRTLVELSTKGSSQYLGTTLVILTMTTLLSITVGLTYMYTRREA